MWSDGPVSSDTTSHPVTLRAADKALAALYDVALLDLDGVVYRGEDAVPHAAVSLNHAGNEGMRRAYVTNNASRTPEAVAEHLTQIGVTAAANEVVTSAQAAARLAFQCVGEGGNVLVIGGEGLLEAVRELGMKPVSSADDLPAVVVQGYSPDLGWRELAEASYAVARGVPWIASNTDMTVPTARGIAPGNGTLVAAVRAATGAVPTVAGKPELPLHRESILRSGAKRPLVVGDRLDTDIEGAVRGGTDSLLVFTGVTRPADLLTAPPERRPTYLAEDLRGLLSPQRLRLPEVDGGRGVRPGGAPRPRRLGGRSAGDMRRGLDGRRIAGRGGRAESAAFVALARVRRHYLVMVSPRPRRTPAATAPPRRGTAPRTPAGTSPPPPSRSPG
jgi:glycerol-1-phosphatase